ncbi:MAG: HNH endonuclease [Sphingobacteriales bacterium]
MQINRHDTTGSAGQKLVGRYRRDHDAAGATENVQTEELPAHGSYGNLLFDPRWKSKRNEILARDKGCCVICSGTEELQVHHRQYQYVKAAKGFKVPWDYPDYLLITLCKSCHQRGHSKFKVPILII